MKGTLNLTNPITINGGIVTSFDYDTNEITVAMFAEADAKKKAAAGRNVGISTAAELDYGLHTYLGMQAIIAVNPNVDMSDLERMKGYDAVELMKTGRNFFIPTSAAPSVPSASDGQSETTAEPSTQPAATSTDGD